MQQYDIIFIIFLKFNKIIMINNKKEFKHLTFKDGNWYNVF